MDIGILGGTFNPIHNGHLMLGEYAYRQFGLDQVWYMPNGRPPHKQDPSIAEDTADRVEMTRLAIRSIPYFRLCTYETEQERLSYTSLTLEHFHQVYPEHRFYFIIGADSLCNIEKWNRPEVLLRYAVILAAYRDDMDTPAEMEEVIGRLNRRYGADIRFLRTPLMDVSSHQIRERIRGGETGDLALPPEVLDYIRQHGLYKGDE